MRRLHLVRVPPIRPEEQNPVKDRFDVGHPIITALREDSVGIDSRLKAHKRKNFDSQSLPQETATRPHVPVEIEIVDGGDAATVLVRVVHVFYVMRTVTRITCDHCLEKQ